MTAASSTRIAVLGAGHIGGVLARRWAAAGRDVTVGLRDDRPPGDDGLPVVAVRSVPEAVADADVVVFAIPGAAMATLIGDLGPTLEGKLVIDAANVVGAGPMNSRASFAQAAPGVRYVRAFNSVGHEVLAQPVVDGAQADGFWCGPADATALVGGLIADVGLRPIRLGGSENADVVDGLLRAWFTLAIREGRGRRVALRVIEEPAHAGLEGG
jgi:predicted dinucleotide-binding enzyme